MRAGAAASRPLCTVRSMMRPRCMAVSLLVDEPAPGSFRRTRRACRPRGSRRDPGRLLCEPEPRHEPVRSRSASPAQALHLGHVCSTGGRRRQQEGESAPGGKAAMGRMGGRRPAPDDLAKDGAAWPVEGIPMLHPRLLGLLEDPPIAGGGKLWHFKWVV